MTRLLLIMAFVAALLVGYAQPSAPHGIAGFHPPGRPVREELPKLDTLLPVLAKGVIPSGPVIDKPLPQDILTGSTLLAGLSTSPGAPCLICG